MLRIRDPEPSLRFYTGLCGMTLIERLTFDDMGFTLYFLAHTPDGSSSVPDDAADRVERCFDTPGTLELTHNHGTESDPNFPGYVSGNDEAMGGRGFGHIGFAVPDVRAFCDRAEKEFGCDFVKRPDDGKMKGIAFVKDPDGYWVEILNARHSRGLVERKAQA